MVQNRLKTMRKVKRKTQQEIASIIGIGQNTYSYWESGKVKIDNESIYKLAEYYGVSADFLLGRKYKLTKSPQEWHHSLREDYAQGDIYLKEYMEYMYGEIVYIDNISGSVNIHNSIIGDNNSDCLNNEGKDRLEKMLLSTFNKLSDDHQFEVIAFAKNLLKEEGKEEE